MIHFSLKKAILESGYKQGFVARKAGMDPTDLSKKLNGYRHLNKKEKQRLSEILNIAIKDLFPEE